VRQKVKLGFLVVGHTHEDIDRCFEYFSKKLKEKNKCILAYLMKAFMVSHDRPFIPQLIQEFPNIKTWVLGCLKDDLETLVGHIDMHLFRFFVDSFGWFVMKYKVSSTNNVWSPIKAPPI
jgi:hypothetical protein